MTITTSRSITDTVQTLTRRRFLWWTLGGVAGAGVVAGARLSWLSRSPTDGSPVPLVFEHLTDAEYHLFHRAASVLLPVDGTALPHFDVLPFFNNIDHLLGLIDEPVRRDIHRLFFLFDHAPLFSHGKRFVDLPDDQVRLLMDRWSDGNFLQRALGSVIKQFVYVSYWREPATWVAVEFDGPVSERWGIPYLGNAPLPADSHNKGEAA